MKPNTIVLFEHAGLIRIGVVTRRITSETLGHTSVSCEVRLANKAFTTKVETSELLLTDLDESMKSDEHIYFAHPALSVLRTSCEFAEAIKYRDACIANPNEDPDILF